MALQPLNAFTTKAANFADKPSPGMSAAQVKAQFDAAPEELRVFVNNLITQLNTDFALKSEIASALLGQILDGSLTDLKLSNTAGQAKDRLSKVITDLANFMATKGMANGVATLDSSTKLQLNQMNNSVASGTSTLSYTQGGSTTISQQLNLGTDFDRIDMLIASGSGSNVSKLVTVFKNGDIIYQPASNTNAVMISKAEVNPAATPTNTNNIFLQFGNSQTICDITYSNGILTFYSWCNYASGGSYSGTLKIRWFAK